MPVFLRYECHACGAPSLARGNQAWVRCDWCRALLGFDWQAWFESPEYGAWLRGAAAAAPAWGRYQKIQDEAKKLAARGKLEKAEARLREAAEMLLELTPHLYPPDVRDDSAYRERWLRSIAWTQLAMQADPGSARGWEQVSAILARVDYRDPMPVLEEVATLYAKLLDRLLFLPGAPADPDGMPPAARRRVSLTQFLSAWLHLVPQEGRLELLRRMHGRDNVVVSGDAGDDEVGLFAEWACPRCGLVSLQSRGTPRLVCPGCYSIRAAGSGQAALAATELDCPGCGARVALQAGALSMNCGHCGSEVRRLARTGDAERALMLSVERSYGGAEIEESAGFPPEVGDEATLLRTGLARLFGWYHSLVGPARFARLLRRSLPGLDDPALAEALDEVEALGRVEGLDPGAFEAIEQTRRLLRGDGR